MRGQSLGYVDDLAFARKDVRPQMQVTVLVASEVQQNVAIWTFRGIDVRFVRKARVVRVELLGEMNELTTIAWILKQYDVLRIQTDGSHVPVFVKKVLHHENNRNVSVVRSAREQPSHPFVCLIHQIIVND